MLTDLALLLGGVAFAFAVSIGAHYTGACMGMPFAAGAITARRALATMAVLAFVGAVIASERVESTVGHGLLATPVVALGLALAAITSAAVLTSLYNLVTVPTSTIQILVFSTVGAGLAAGVGIDWSTIDGLIGLWLAAPFLAFGLGWLGVRAADRFWPAGASGAPGRLAPRAALALVLVGSAASFAMGANDVSNASGALVMTGLFGLAAAAVVGGIGLAVGVASWGAPLLKRVAFDLVQLDPRMATVSQLAQSAVILGAVSIGLFTSMNQALVGAMIGAGVARGQRLVLWKAVRGIMLGWALGPVSGLVLGFGLALGFRAVGL